MAKGHRTGDKSPPLASLGQFGISRRFGESLRPILMRPPAKFEHFFRPAMDGKRKCGFKTLYCEPFSENALTRRQRLC
jgi:hypothetical protein